MLRNWDLRADLTDERTVDPCRDNARAVRSFRNHVPPGINNQGMAIGLAHLLFDKVEAGLGGRTEIGLCLDGTCTAKNLPMIFAGLCGEGSGQGDHFRALRGQRLKEVRKSYIVADSAADDHAFAWISDDGTARCEGRAFVIFCSVWRGDIEHMDFAVAGDFRAGAIEDHGCVVNALASRRLFENGTGMDEDFMLLGERLHGAIGSPARKHKVFIHAGSILEKPAAG